MILGIDISTSITGFAVVAEGELVFYDSIDLRKYKNIFDKTIAIKEKLLDLDPDLKSEYWDRVKMELSVLESKNFSSYMLIVSNYINWAKERMPVGPARGSAAGSLVAYLTGITNIDPIEYGLIFERFHNNKKKSFPDVDSDFSNPGLVKEYLSDNR